MDVQRNYAVQHTQLKGCDGQRGPRHGLPNGPEGGGGEGWEKRRGAAGEGWAEAEAEAEAAAAGAKEKDRTEGRGSQDEDAIGLGEAGRWW